MKLEEIRFWGLTFIMTAMIWLVADQHVTRSVELTVPFEVEPELPDAMAVRTLHAPSFLQIGVSGPNRAIGVLKAREDSLRPKVRISSTLSSGSYKLNLLDEIRALKDQFVQGVVVSSVSPQSLDIQVDRYVSKEVPIRLETGQLEFDGKPQLEPATVIVTVPETQFEQLEPQRREIVLPVSPAFKDAAEGTLIRKVLFLPADVGGLKPWSVQPQQVTVCGTLKALAVEGRIRTVPIKLLISNDVSDRYIVLFGGQEDIITREVIIRGPADIVHALQDGTPTQEVRGYIEVGSQDYRQDLKDGEFIPKPPQFILPPGVELVQEPDLVDIRLVPRPPA